MKKEKSLIPKELLAPSDEFLAASEQIGLHWWYWDNLVKKISVSPALIQLLGFTPEEFDPSKPSIYKNIHPDDVEENLKRIRNLIYGESQLYEMEFRVRDSQGEWQWFYNRGTVISHDENGKGTLVGGITMDISGQFKQMMSKLEEQEKFEFIFRNTNEAIVAIEMDKGKPGRVVDANNAASQFFERVTEGRKMSLPMELNDDDVIGERSELFKQVLKKGYGHVEFEHEIEKGDKRWLDITAHSFNLTGKNLLIAIASDQTKGKKTEAALRETERLYRTLFDAADDPIGLFSVDREIILINKAFHATFGYEREEFLGFGWMEKIHEDDREMLESLGEKLLLEGNLSVDYRVKHKEGHYLYVSSKNVVIHGDPGDKILILTIIRDVTERKRAMEELEDAKQMAVESDKLKSAFLANMSHEIRTPMNSIVGFSNLLVNPGLSEEARELYVKRIVRNSELLLTLISDIIDLAKIESGQLPIIYGRQNLKAIIGDVEQYARDELSRLGKDGIVIIASEKNGDCELETDVVRLVQIMKNLVNNAIKFTESGSVEIGCDKSGGNVILFVKDSGIGISADNFDLIFDQFRQIDGSNTRRFGGTGLGLAICKNLVHMMGGRIWVESTEGSGATFYLELPVNATLSLDPKVSLLSDSEVDAGLDKSLKVMVVDDEHDSAELFREILQALGHSVVTAPSGYEALRLLEKPPLPHVVFMDVRMPVLSGTDTMRIMKQRHASIKVVAQSAHALVGDRDRFLNEGFDSYLAKPFSGEQIAEVVNLLS